MKDLQSKIGVSQSIAPAAITATTNGAGVDLLGFRSAVLMIIVGAISDGTHTPSLQESDNNSDWTAVGASDQVGTLAALTAQTPQKVGYKGTKRYVRAVSTVAGASTGGVYSMLIVKGDSELSPVS